MNARHLILVRHAQPQIVQGVPARAWRLSAEGRAACLPLAEQLAQYRPAVLASSMEPKALETARIVGSGLGLSVTPVAGLHEHERGPVRGPVRDLDQQDFGARVAAFFAHPQELVWGAETAAQAHDRFTRAEEGVVQAHPDGDVIVVAHGTVITLYVAACTGVEPFAFWRRLRLPDMVALSLGSDPNRTPA